jgi:hypothetical protein
MPSDQLLHLTGELRPGRFFLQLHTAEGAIWSLDATRDARKLVGQQVEVIGRPAGFNDLLCEQIWPAGEPRPASGFWRKLSRLELLLIVLGLVGALLLL